MWLLISLSPTSVPLRGVFLRDVGIAFSLSLLSGKMLMKLIRAAAHLFEETLSLLSRTATAKCHLLTSSAEELSEERGLSYKAGISHLCVNGLLTKGYEEKTHSGRLTTKNTDKAWKQRCKRFLSTYFLNIWVVSDQIFAKENQR